MNDKPETERTDCHAWPDAGNTRIGIGPGEVWHTPDCPALTIFMINMEAGSRRVHEQEAWAKGVFPAAHDRLKKAAAALPADPAAQPFIAALTELVQAQADTTGFVVLHQWAEILERHFPPELPDLDHMGQ
ncbi:hypothetical protein J7E99_02810 [Streptomyces sp. ISL-44]|uniref:hypothetical protein n=1 Tax=Streptomyces sp. ISL-44 TaxID=2819184 RepID=UPI001BEBB0FE|nr:hypothetical protein [Streptomyces sp. ISL-44]MBT2539665.1 hypothetical protein [Streptomyces sp. ISL-44]